MERWLDKVSNSLHPVINLKNVDHVNTKKILINTKKEDLKNKDTKVRVDNNPKTS
jgi:hypothetical protein